MDVGGLCSTMGRTGTEIYLRARERSRKTLTENIQLCNLDRLKVLCTGFTMLGMIRRGYVTGNVDGVTKHTATVYTLHVIINFPTTTRLSPRQTRFPTDISR